MVPQTSWRTDRQTWSSQYFATAPAGKVKITACHSNAVRLLHYQTSTNRWLNLLLHPRELWRLAKYSDEHVCVFVCVCMSVCLSASMSPETRAIFTSFFMHVAYGRGWVLFRQGDEIPMGIGNFGGCSGHSTALVIFTVAIAAAFAGKGIIQSPITSRSSVDNSACQAKANRNPENSERRRCGLSTAKGVMGVHSAGEV